MTYADSDIAKALQHIVTPHLSDNLQRMSGLVGLHRFHHARKLIGRAVTVKCRPGDNLMIYKALMDMQPGQVLVVDGGGDGNNALWLACVANDPALVMTLVRAGVPIEVRAFGALADQDIAAETMLVEREKQLANAIDETLSPKGVGVVMRCTHFCMCSRGVNKQGSTTTTSALRGAIREKPEARAEFMGLVLSGR